MAAGLVAAVFSVVGLGIKQLAAVSAAELPDAITACFIHGFQNVLVFAFPLFSRHSKQFSFPECYGYMAGFQNDNFNNASMNASMRC